MLTVLQTNSVSKTSVKMSAGMTTNVTLTRSAKVFGVSKAAGLMWIARLTKLAMAVNVSTLALSSSAVSTPNAGPRTMLHSALAHLASKEILLNGVTRLSRLARRTFNADVMPHAPMEFAHPNVNQPQIVCPRNCARMDPASGFAAAQPSVQMERSVSTENVSKDAQGTANARTTKLVSKVNVPIPATAPQPLAESAPNARPPTTKASASALKECMEIRSSPVRRTTSSAKGTVALTVNNVSRDSA